MQISDPYIFHILTRHLQHSASSKHSYRGYLRLHSKSKEFQLKTLPYDPCICYVYCTYICSFRHGGSCMRWGWMIVFRLTAVAFQTCPLWDCLGGRVSEKKKGRKRSGRKHWELPWWECQCGLPDQIGSGEQHNHSCGSCSSCNLWSLGFGEGPGILAS